MGPVRTVLGYTQNTNHVYKWSSFTHLWTGSDFVSQLWNLATPKAVSKTRNKKPGLIKVHQETWALYCDIEYCHITRTSYAIRCGDLNFT